MLDWLGGIGHSLINQTAIWIVSAVIAVFGVFSNRIAEKLKYSLNRADLNAKYYEEFAEALSLFVLSIDRYINVYAKGTWASDDDKAAIASMYNSAANTLWKKEYVYYSWVHRHWNRKTGLLFEDAMAITRKIDSTLIQINEHAGRKDGGEVKRLNQDLVADFERLKSVTRAMLVRMV
jgi:hypothetical protein